MRKSVGTTLIEYGQLQLDRTNRKIQVLCCHKVITLFHSVINAIVETCGLVSEVASGRETEILVESDPD